MASMSYLEAIEKLRLLNRGDEPKFFVNQSNVEVIYVQGDIDTLVLNDGPMGDVFEWVDDTHKQLRSKVDHDLVVDIKPVADFPLTAIRTEVSGPNKTVLTKLNSMINAMFIPAEGRDPATLHDADGSGHFIENTEENRAKYDALMQFYTCLEHANVFDGAAKEDVMEFRMKIKGTDGKTIYPIFVNKNNIHKILKYINILKTFGDEFELPNEFYQMIVNGDNFEMKNIVGSTEKVPEPKLASETVSEYEDRLKAKYGEPEVNPATGYRQPYAHEKINYSPTVKASSVVEGDNPTVSGDSVDTLSSDGSYLSEYYTHFAASQNKKKNRFVFVDDGPVAPVKSRIDESLGSKIRSALKGFFEFLREHKLGVLITVGVVGAGVALTVAGGWAPLLKGIVDIVFNVAKVFLVPIPKFLLGMPMTVADKWFAILEVIALIYGAVKLHKKRKAKREAEKIPVEEEMAQLNAIIEENQRNISDAEGILISINATLSDPYATEEEKNAARVEYERISQVISTSRKQLDRAKARLKKITPLDATEEELGFTNPEGMSEGGLRF